jgi:hypothetical protein
MFAVMGGGGGGRNMAQTYLKVGTRWTCVGQVYALATVTTGERDPGTYQREGWVSTRLHGDVLEKSEICCPCQESNCDSLAVWWHIH